MASRSNIQNGARDGGPPEHLVKAVTTIIMVVLCSAAALASVPFLASDFSWILVLNAVGMYSAILIGAIRLAGSAVRASFGTGVDLEMMKLDEVCLASITWERVAWLVIAVRSGSSPAVRAVAMVSRGVFAFSCSSGRAQRARAFALVFMACGSFMVLEHCPICANVAMDTAFALERVLEISRGSTWLTALATSGGVLLVAAGSRELALGTSHSAACVLLRAIGDCALFAASLFDPLREPLATLRAREAIEPA